MCGITGIVTQGSAQPFRGVVAAMVGALSHRGPDSTGIECLGECVLGNTRLAIIDLSERGQQPMSNEDQSIWISYNGEIYNSCELRQMLMERGHRFRSATDTEVVLHLYEELGQRCVERLRGMFAFAIWDARSRKLVLARDRLGIKPLYYAITREGLLFASEVKALLASGLLPRKLDPAGLRVFLQLGHVPPPWTVVQQAKPLEPGHVAAWRDEKLSSSSYWNLQDGFTNRQAPRPGKLAAELAEVFLDAVSNHLVSDVPVVMFLSGGIDSACLAAAARQASVHSRNLTAMTIGFSENTFDESKLSARTARALGIPHRIVKVSARQIEANLDHVIWAMDQPTVDGLNSYWVSRLAAEAGFKVALSGQGGDEFFGGYESWAWFQRFYEIARLFRHLPVKPFAWLLDRAALPFRWRKLSYLFLARDPFVASQLAVKVMFLERNLEGLLPPALARNGYDSEAERHLTYWAKFVEKQNMKEKLAFMDIHTHLEPRLLRDLDAMSMAHSLEVRPAFLDHRLVEFLLLVPSSIRMQQKRLLLEAAKRFMPHELYRDLLTRRKRTSTFPFAVWLSRDLQHTMQWTFDPGRLQGVGVLNSSAVTELWKRYLRSSGAVGWSRIWSLFVLQRWCETMRMTC